MNHIVILTGGRNGMASWCLPRLVSDKRFKVAGVIFSRSEIVNKKRHVLRRLKKILRIGVLGALNGIRIRKWYHDSAEDLFEVCKKYSIPLYQVSSLYGKDLPALLNHLHPDLGVSLGNGYIPERVFTMTSITTKRTRKFENSLGRFTYYQVKPSYFPIGIRSVEENGVNCLMAGPEKALCDTILYDSYLPSQSVMRLEQYLEEDIRFDMDALNEFDISIIEACAQNGGKEQIFNNLIKIIKRV